MNIVASIAAAIAALSFAAVGASAADLELTWVKADGTVVGEKTMSREDLEALPQTTFTTNTPWTTVPTEFRGPAIADLADLGPPNAVTANVTALNDYTAALPSEDWTDLGATLVIRTDGELMKVRDKGPFWVMYPIDNNPKMLDTQLFHSRMVWQVQSIEFVVE